MVAVSFKLTAVAPHRGGARGAMPPPLENVGGATCHFAPPTQLVWMGGAIYRLPPPPARGFYHPPLKMEDARIPPPPKGRRCLKALFAIATRLAALIK